MSHVRRADWAANVDWSGIANKPPLVDGPNGNITISDVQGLQAALNGKMDKGSLATVATTGDYNDLENLPPLGSAAFANVGDFLQAPKPNAFQTDVVTFTVGAPEYEVFFAGDMKAIPKINLQVLMSDGTGESFYAVVEEDSVTVSGFKFWLSGLPSLSSGKCRWWATVQDDAGATFNPIFPVIPAEPETIVWLAGISGAGGTLAVDSENIANNLVIALKAKSYYSSIIYVLPLLGADIIAARMPLIDVHGVGISTNSGFVNADFSQSTGIQGNTVKYLDSKLHPADLGAGGNGGIGFWENNFAPPGGNTEAMGCYDNTASNRFVIDLRTTLHFFSWSGPGNAANAGTAATNKDYYGQRSSASLRKIYSNGVLDATNTVADAGSGLSDETIIINGCNEGGSIVGYPNRCAVAYMTDGTLSDPDILDLHNTLQAFLITPTGR